MIGFVEKVLRKLLKHRVWVLIISLGFTVFFGWYAVHVEIRADADSLLPNRDEDMQRFAESGIPQNDYLVIGVERENLFELEFLSLLKDTIDKIMDEDDIISIATPFNQTAFEKRGAFFTLVNSTDSGNAPSNQEELALFKKRIIESPLSKGIILSHDETMFLILVEYSEVDDFSRFMTDIDAMVKPLREVSTVYLSGNPPFEVSAKKYLLRDISIFLSLGIILILGVYYFGFNSKRSMFLPVLVIIMGTIWTIGFMSIMGFAISIVSIVVPPLVLTLGSSYSIHILNSYFRFTQEGSRDKMWISRAVASVSSTIVLASLTTVVGFLSLLVTSLSQMQEFALASSFGILSCSVMSMTVLPCILSFLENPHSHQTEGIHEGLITRFIKKISRRIIRNRWKIVILFFCIPVVFVITYPHIRVNTDYATYFPDDDQVVIDLTKLVTKMKGFSELTILFTSEEKNKFLDLDTLKQLNTLEMELENVKYISNTRSFNTFVREAQFVTRGTRDFPTSKGSILFLSRALNSFRERDEASKELIDGFVNEDYTRYNITFRYYDYETGLAMGEDVVPLMIDQISQVVSAHLPEGVEFEITGPRMFFQDLYNQLTKDLALSTLTAFILIFFVSSYTFKSFTYGILSLIPMFAGVLLNFVIMVLASIPLDLTTVMVSCVSIGIGVDDSIHFLLHYKREGSLRHTMELTGRPIVLTSLSIVAGLALLLFSTFRPIGYFGILISIALINTTIGCLVFLPAFISLWETAKRKKRIRRNMIAGR
jgi:hydrophobe/amphiphile efflux-3 (HAE3) family protein